MQNNVKLARPDLVIDPIHDNRHQLRDVPFARESVPYLVHLPDEGIALFTYTWVNKNHEAGALIAIFGPGVGDEPIEIAIPDKPIDPNMKFDNWELDGFLMRQDNQFGDARIQLNGGRADFDMEFNGSHPPYAYGSNRNGCPSFMADNRIEQGGRMHGTLTLKENLNEREIQFDTTGHRDHSWGVRDWSSILHYKWFHGQVGKDVCVHFWHMHALGWTRNWGYVFKDGLLAEVIDVELDVDFTDTYAQQAMRATLTDEAGRKTFIEGEFYAWYPLIPDPNVSLIESAARAQIDGAEGVGWMETTWLTSYLEHIRSVAAS